MDIRSEQITVGRRKVNLRLTLGAIKQIERELDLQSINEVMAAGRFGAGAIITVLIAMSSAAGNPVTEEELLDLDFTIEFFADVCDAMDRLTKVPGANVAGKKRKAPAKRAPAKRTAKKKTTAKKRRS